MGLSASAPAHLDLAAAINRFGGSLFDKLVAEAEPGTSIGIFLSPYGIAQALAMLLNGVEPGGASYHQLQGLVFSTAVDRNLALEALNSHLGQLNTALIKEPTDDLTISNANGAWVAQKCGLQPAYAKVLKEAFHAAAAPITSAAAINSWVAEATRGKISGIVDEGAVSQATLVLVNALYFKGLWQSPFDKGSTRPQPFHPLAHDSAPFRAATMYKLFKPPSALKVATLQATVPGGTMLECSAVQLPYKGAEYYAVAAMPAGQFSEQPADGGTRGLIASGGALVPYPQALAACRQALLAQLPTASEVAGGKVGEAGGLWQRRPEDVKLYLPRFEVEFSASLNDALQALGVTQPFNGGDLTRIAVDSTGNAVRDLFVSDVLHKVYAKVDEAGTEAAAATAVVMLRSAMVVNRPQLELRFDRPFVFAVVHAPTGLALFCGEVHRPEEWRADS